MQHKVVLHEQQTQPQAPIKSVSLPRIRTQNHEPAPPKLTQLHKIKWSIAPKCLLPGHEGQ